MKRLPFEVCRVYIPRVTRNDRRLPCRSGLRKQNLLPPSRSLRAVERVVFIATRRFIPDARRECVRGLLVRKTLVVGFEGIYYHAPVTALEWRRVDYKLNDAWRDVYVYAFYEGELP